MDDKNVRQAKRELFGLFAFLVTIGFFAAMVGAFIWMYLAGAETSF